MGNSDTDSENECFESAEESLDESEEVNSVKKQDEKNEKEVVKSLYENVDSVPQMEKDVSGNSMSYRKRPDRVKRSVSNIAPKPTSKKSADAILKPDKIVPDAFFQDITSNLSKNINKSLSTLQQKSSNMKDLILSTLPVTFVEDGEGFSYDDTEEKMMYDPEVQDLGEKLQSEETSDLFIENIIEEKTVKKEESHIDEKLITETNFSITDKFSSNNEKRKPPDLSRNSKESRSERDFNSHASALEDNTEEKILNLTLKENQNALDSHQDRIDKNKNKGGIESISKQSEETSNNDVSNFNCIENSSDNDNIIGISLTEPVNFLLQTKEVLGSTIKEPGEPSETENVTEKNCECDKLLESSQPDQLPFVENESVDSVSNTQAIQESQIPNDGVYLIKNMCNEKSEVNSECNFKDLKTALENIVQEKTTDLNKIANILENDCKKEDITSKVEKVYQSSNDGWDDFDFNDDEVESIVTNDIDTKGADLEFTVADNKGAKTAAAEEKTSDNKGGAKPVTNVVKQHFVIGDSVLQENVDSRNNSKEVSKEVAVPEQALDETWDWNDSWDDTPEDNKEKVDISTKPKSDKPGEDSSDISKWSGWDTFAQKPQEKQGNWGLGSWGMDMLLNKATAVTQGISNVLEVGLGAPDPETLARMEKLEREKLKELETEGNQDPEDILKKNSLSSVNYFPVSGITSLVAGVTSKIVEHAKIQEIGSKVITGGLDTLETFGKKTMEVLQEGDPGLKNKRALLMGNSKPVLSQVLREAREKADREIKKAEEKEMAKKCHFETLFDDFQGMVHLEALEMLSRQCELKLEQIRSGMNSEEQEDLNGILEEVEQLCALDDCELDLKSSVLDFKTALHMAVEPLKNEISVHKIIQIHENVTKWLQMSSQAEYSPININQKLVSTLAELAAATVQQFHKSGELLSVKECRKTVEEVDALSRLTNILCTEINKLSEKFILLSHSKTSKADSSESLSCLTESVTVVMNNSTSYIRQAFDLLIPVMQLGAAV